MPTSDFFMSGPYKRVQLVSAKDSNKPNTINNSFKLEDVYAVKILGRAIGAASEIVDGDGDGFYTPFEGAGDKTPVPGSAAVRRAAKAKKKRRPQNPTAKPKNTSSDPLTESWKSMRKELNEIRKKHPDISTQKKAFAVLKQYYPNLDEENNGHPPEHVLKAHQKSIVYSLIALAERFPDAAKALRGIDLEGDKVIDSDPSIADALGAHSWAGDGRQIVHFSDRKLRILGERWEDLMDHEMVKTLVAGQAERDLDFGGPAQRFEMFLLGITAHEVGHAQHATKTWQYLGLDANKPRDALKKIAGLSDAEIDDLLEQMEKRIKLHNLVEDDPKKRVPLTQEAIWNNVVGSVWRSHILPAMEAAKYDGLTKQQIDDSLEEMNKLSEYARSEGFEAIAESMAAGILRFQWTPEMQNLPLIQWLLGGTTGMMDEKETKQADKPEATKAKKIVLRRPSNETFLSFTCSGIPSAIK